MTIGVDVPHGAHGLETEILVVGSGAGGSVTAAALAEAGHEVLLLEEGPAADTSRIATNSTEAITRLYRNGGMTPILGRQTVAFVEGRCVGGSTEINSGLWHRLPDDAYHRWRADVLLADFSPEGMAPYFERIERDLSVSLIPENQIPKSSRLFRKGIEHLGWEYQQVPRCQKNSGSQFAPGAKQSMQRTYIPRALASGARLLADAKATKLATQGDRVVGVHVLRDPYGARRRVEIRAETVFLCGGAIQTPALLRRSGVKRNVGESLRIHPMIKAAALFDEEVDAHEDALPVYQVKEFWPTITMGGAVFTPGFLAMILADSWKAYQHAMPDWPRMGLYYAGTRAMVRGSVRAIRGLDDGVVIRYRLSEADRENLSTGLGLLGELLFAAGARAVYPSLTGAPILRSADQCRGLVKAPIPLGSMALSNVHAFSTCPMGENRDVCATDSFGKVHGLRNLYINDASLIPDAPGVNPQGTTMAIAFRNSEHFMHERRSLPARGRPATTARPAYLLTGAPGWLGTRLAETLMQGPTSGVLRCLVRPSDDARGLERLSERLTLSPGDLTDPPSLRDLCRDAEGATLFHVAGLIHPRLWTRDFDRVNAEGTRALLAAAEEARVRRAVVVSSNSPLGCNPLVPGHVFDESSPYDPYMGYGRSKQRMEALVHEVQARGRLETVIIRPPWFYGPHQPPRQTLFFTMIKDGKFPVLGDGTQRRSMAYVDNICQGLLLAAAAPQANGETYWIADARPYTINEIVETVTEVLESFGFACKRKQMRLPRAVGEIARVVDGALQGMGLYQQKLHVLGEMHQSIACSIAKAERELGYAPAVALRDGMATSIEWCLANGHHI
ncbi:MAG: GMC family oxidoreductase N-terminal domain-containing protein [Deltaproteobacteria bacterium]|nr:GMC family oxidoreductase N-terminal domain-containing protein [Deltaproteobacteria bacterium]